MKETAGDVNELGTWKWVLFVLKTVIPSRMMYEGEVQWDRSYARPVRLND